MEPTLLVTFIVCWAIYLFVKRGVRVAVRFELNTNDGEPVVDPSELKAIHSLKRIKDRLPSDQVGEQEIVNDTLTYPVGDGRDKVS